MSTLCGASLVANLLLRQLLGVELPTLALFAIGVLGSFYIAFRDIQLSAKMMLAFEAVALLLVLVLGGLIWLHQGFAVDTAQLRLEGATATDALAGVVLVIFGFSGFESSTVLGGEAKKPLETIPRSVSQSVLLAGFFFIVMAYIVVLGFRGHSEPLAESEAPLNSLAAAIGWSGLARAIDVGILLSFFSCTLASINSSARILFSMAQHRLIADAIGHSHLQNRTPHVAVALCALLTFCVPAALYLAGVPAFEAQGYFGTLCSFGFIVVYVLVSLAAPRYLASIGKLDRRAVAYSLGSIAFLALPVLATIGIPGSELFPPPDEVGVLLVGIFAVYMASGIAWLALRRWRHPRMISHMKGAIERAQLQFAAVRESADTK
jgi:amino acid transporter